MLAKACVSPSAAGAMLASALLAGGDEARAAVPVLSTKLCADGSDPMERFADYVNDAGNKDIERVVK